MDAECEYCQIIERVTNSDGFHTAEGWWAMVCVRCGQRRDHHLLDHPHCTTGSYNAPCLAFQLLINEAFED